MSSDDLEDEIRRQVKEQYDRTIEVPRMVSPRTKPLRSWSDGTRERKGIELPEADVRAEVREKMGSRDTT